MTLLDTDAVVLHSADYLESSRILRLATREAGVQSVLARGARSSRKRFGSAMGLFAEGQAQIRIKPGRDLHTLERFDVLRIRTGLAAELGRFAAASAFAELVMRVVHDESAPRVYDGMLRSFDTIAAAEPSETVSVALGAIWQLVSEVGFSPSMESCAECHAPLRPEDDATFSHLSGGVLCERCGMRAAGGRRLPPSARRTIAAWLQPGDAPFDASIPPTVSGLSKAESKAHQRLLREFITHHLPDNRVMRAYAVWEQATLLSPAAEREV